eukprot:COSAG01_NODE_36473_length_517_cov_1.100478_1_plen_33_part_01
MCCFRTVGSQPQIHYEAQNKGFFIWAFLIRILQ